MYVILALKLLDIRGRVMLNKIFLYALNLLVLLTSVSCISAHTTKLKSTIIPIERFAEIPTGILDQNPLVMIDIDNTILRQVTYAGSHEHYDHLVKNTKDKHNLTKPQASLRVTQDWKTIVENARTKLVDMQFNDFISTAKKDNDAVIAFTARPPTYMAITIKQLQEHNVTLSKLDNFYFKEFYRNQIFPDLDWCNLKQNISKCQSGTLTKQYHETFASFENGILFGGDLNSKGAVFIDFFTKYKEYLIRQGKSIPNVVIFIDDKMYNIHSMQTAARSLGLHFYGYHIAIDFSK